MPGRGERWRAGRGPVLALSLAALLGCGARRAAEAHTTPAAGAAGPDRVVTALSQGPGHYVLVTGSGAVHELELTADGVRSVRRGRSDDDVLAWYFREWRKDRSQWRTQSFVHSGDRTLGVLGGRLLGHREFDGSLLESPRLTATVQERAFIVWGDAGDAVLLVAAERAGALALVELRLADLTVAREALIAAESGEGTRRVAVAGDQIFVAALVKDGLRVRTLRRADLTLLQERLIPVAALDAAAPAQRLAQVLSPGGRWLAAHLGADDRVLVIDTASWSVARDLRGYDAVYGFSDDERVLHLGVACVEPDCDATGEAIVYAEREGAALSWPHDDFAWTELEATFAWAVSADLTRVRRWDFDDLSRERSYPLAPVLRAAHDDLDEEYCEEHGRACNYPLAVAFDRRGDLLVAEWDGRELWLSRVHERGAETLLRSPLAAVELVHIDAGAEALVVVTADGALTVFELHARPVRLRLRTPTSQ